MPTLYEGLYSTQALCSEHAQIMFPMFKVRMALELITTIIITAITYYAFTICQAFHYALYLIEIKAVSASVQGQPLHLYSAFHPLQFSLP